MMLMERGPARPRSARLYDGTTMYPPEGTVYAVPVVHHPHHQLQQHPHHQLQQSHMAHNLSPPPPALPPKEQPRSRKSLSDWLKFGKRSRSDDRNLRELARPAVRTFASAEYGDVPQALDALPPLPPPALARAMRYQESWIADQGHRPPAQFSAPVARAFGTVTARAGVPARPTARQLFEGGGPVAQTNTVVQPGALVYPWETYAPAEYAVPVPVAVPVQQDMSSPSPMLPQIGCSCKKTLMESVRGRSKKSTCKRCGAEKMTVRKVKARSRASVGSTPDQYQYQDPYVVMQRARMGEGNIYVRQRSHSHDRYGVPVLLHGPSPPSAYAVPRIDGRLQTAYSRAIETGWTSSGQGYESAWNTFQQTPNQPDSPGENIDNNFLNRDPPSRKRRELVQVPCPVSPAIVTSSAPAPSPVKSPMTSFMPEPEKVQPSRATSKSPAREEVRNSNGESPDSGSSSLSEDEWSAEENNEVEETSRDLRRPVSPPATVGAINSGSKLAKLAQAGFSSVRIANKPNHSQNLDFRQFREERYSEEIRRSKEASKAIVPKKASVVSSAPSAVPSRPAPVPPPPPPPPPPPQHSSKSTIPPPPPLPPSDFPQKPPRRRKGNNSDDEHIEQTSAKSSTVSSSEEKNVRKPDLASTGPQPLITMSDLLKVKSILKKTPAPDSCSNETDTTNTSSNYAESPATTHSSTDSDSPPPTNMLSKQKRVHFRSHESLDRKVSAEEQRRDIVRAITDAYDRVNRTPNEHSSASEDAARSDRATKTSSKSNDISTTADDVTASSPDDGINEAEYANSDVTATGSRVTSGEVTVSGSTVAIEIGENGEWRTTNVNIATDESDSVRLSPAGSPVSNKALLFNDTMRIHMPQSRPSIQSVFPSPDGSSKTKIVKSNSFRMHLARPRDPPPPPPPGTVTTEPSGKESSKENGQYDVKDKIKSTMSKRSNSEELTRGGETSRTSGSTRLKTIGPGMKRPVSMSSFSPNAPLSVSGPISEPATRRSTVGSIKSRPPPIRPVAIPQVPGLGLMGRSNSTLGIGLDAQMTEKRVPPLHEDGRAMSDERVGADNISRVSISSDVSDTPPPLPTTAPPVLSSTPPPSMHSIPASSSPSPPPLPSSSPPPLTENDDSLTPTIDPSPETRLQRVLDSIAVEHSQVSAFSQRSPSLQRHLPVNETAPRKYCSVDAMIDWKTATTDYETDADHIYEEIPEQKPRLRALLQAATGSPAQVRSSMFGGASRAEILSYLQTARERELGGSSADSDVEYGALGARDSTGRNSYRSSNSDSSEYSRTLLTRVGRRPSAEVERTDSGVGSETSKGQIRLAKRGNHDCDDCDQTVETQTTDSGVQYDPSVCRKCLKKRQERKEILTEIVETELKYGRDLRVMMEEFYRPMLVAGLLTHEQLSQIFLNVEELLEVSRQLTARLKERLELALNRSDEDLQTVNIGRAFLEGLDNMLRAFETYCTRQGAASLLLSSLEKEKELLRVFLKVSQMENSLLRRMNLSSFLMVPIQRVTKYPLLLSRLRNVTPEGHPSCGTLADVQERIEMHLEHMNAAAKESGGSRIWRRISMIGGSTTNIKRSVSEQDITTLKLRKFGLDMLEWPSEDATIALEGRLLYTAPSENNWTRRGRFSVRLTAAHALLVTRGGGATDWADHVTDADQSAMFPRTENVRQSALLLIKDKAPLRLALVRDPLRLERCIVCTDPEVRDCFEVHDSTTKESLIVKAEDGERTDIWLRYLQYFSMRQGAWRKRRNGLANIMIGLAEV